MSELEAQDQAYAESEKKDLEKHRKNKPTTQNSPPEVRWIGYLILTKKDKEIEVLSPREIARLRLRRYQQNDDKTQSALEMDSSNSEKVSEEKKSMDSKAQEELDAEMARKIQEEEDSFLALSVSQNSSTPPRRLSLSKEEKEELDRQYALSLQQELEDHHSPFSRDEFNDTPENFLESMMHLMRATETIHQRVSEDRERVSRYSRGSRYNTTNLTDETSHFPRRRREIHRSNEDIDMSYEV